MADGWAYASYYRSEQERRDALKDWLHHYHQPPVSRLANVPSQYS